MLLVKFFTSYELEKFLLEKNLTLLHEEEQKRIASRNATTETYSNLFLLSHQIRLCCHMHQETTELLCYCPQYTTELKSTMIMKQRCLDCDSAPVVLLSEVELEPGVKVECVSKFCYLGDTLGSGGGVVEAARASRVRCAWAKFKELSPILTVRGASYRVKGRIYSACVQSVLIYGTETWAMKADDLHMFGKDRTYDGEMDVWGVLEGQKVQ